MCRATSHIIFASFILLVAFANQADQPATANEPLCTRDDFAFLQQKQTCLLKNTDQKNCLSRTLAEAAFGNTEAQKK